MTDAAKSAASVPPAHRRISERVSHALVRAGNRTVLVDDWNRWTGRELLEAARAMARALLDISAPGELRVLLSAPNSGENVIAWLATMLAGGVWSSVNPRYADAEKTDLIARFDPTIMLTDPASADALGAANACEVIAFEPGDPRSEFSELLRRARSTGSLPDIDPHAPAAVGFTSGTSGRPRGVIHSQHNLLLAAEGNLSTHKPDGPIGVVLSTTVLNILVLGPLQALLAGRQAVLAASTHAEYLARWSRQHRIAEIGVPPTIIHDLLDAAESAADPGIVPEWFETGGAACTSELQERFARITGRRIHRAYGLTEAPGTVALARGDRADPLSASGVALPHVTLAIRDASGATLPAGETGEICVAAANRGPLAGLYTPMLGYWDEPTQQLPVEKGVLRTGDLGFLDGDGRLTITGRKSALIIRGGANISPAEVEEVLVRHPAVADAAVFGVPDARLGETVAAAITLVPGAAPPTTEALREFASAHLARYKTPRFVVVLPAIPRNPTGKAMREPLLASLAQSHPEISEGMRA